MTRKKRDLTDTPVIYNEGDANFTRLVNDVFNDTDLSEMETLGGHDTSKSRLDTGAVDFLFFLYNIYFSPATT